MKLPIEFLNPAGLWLLSAVVPLVVLYILKIKRDRLRVPSVWLWSAAQRDLLAKSPFRRLIPQIPLFLQLLILILLALAVSRPATRGRAIVGDHIAIIIDTSASMSALDDQGRARIDVAKEAAASVIDALAPGSDAMLVDAGRDARIASPLERDRRRLKAALDLVKAGDVEGHLGDAVALAVDRMRQLGGSTRLLVFTDGALADADALRSVSLPFEVVRVGTPVDNAGIVRVDIRSGIDPVLGTEQVQAFAMLVNFGTRPRELYVTMRETGASDVLASRRLMLKPGEHAPVVLQFNPAPGDIGQGLIIELSPRDALQVDDVAYGRVPPGPKIPVVMASPAGKGSPWLERALASDPLVELFKAPGTDLSSAGIPNGAFIVMSQACPTQLPPGDVLIVAPPDGNCLGATVGAGIENPTITSWANADPRFRFLTLDGVSIAKAHLLKVDSPKHELVHAREGTLVADVSSPGRTGTLIGFDVGESNWPFKASFVLFVRNLVELARAHRSHGMTSAGRAGEPVHLAVPHWIDVVEVIGPQEAKQEIPSRNGLAVVPATTRSGVYHASWKGPVPGSVVFSVNLSSEKESDLTERPIDLAGQGAAVTSADRVTQSHTEWTWLLAALALGLVLADVWFLTRKPLLRTVDAPMRPKVPERRAA